MPGSPVASRRATVSGVSRPRSSAISLASGWAAADVAERFRDHPPAGFLSKPFVLAEVLAALQQAGILGQR